MKLAIFSVFLLFFITISFAEVQEFGYSNPQLPILGEAGNVTLDTVNNSLFWNGYPFDINRWLLIDGSNANQDIDIQGYDLYTGDLWTRNINATNITTENINVTRNATIWLGGVPISANTTFDGDTIVTFGNAFINATGYFGDGGFLENISFVNGTVIAIAFNASNYIGGNFTGDNVTAQNFFGGNFYGIYDWAAETPWLIFNGTYLQFNESYFNQSVQYFIDNINVTALNFSSLTLNGTTITDWSQVNYTTTNDTVTFTTPSFTGSYSVVLNETFHFEIAQIIVTPSAGGRYRFAMYEFPSGQTIDANLRPHFGTWNIFKSYPINGKVSLNFSNVLTSKSFDVTVKYFKNVQG